MALAQQWGNQTPQVCKGGIPKPPCTVSISSAAFSHVQKHCVRSIHALECPMAAGWPLPLATAHMEPAHHVALGPLRSSRNDSTSGSWQGAEDRQAMSSAPRAAVPAGLVPIPQLGAGCLCPEHTRSSPLRSHGATSSCQTSAGQHKGREAKLLPSCL